VDWAIGRGDASEPRPGIWQMTGNRVRVKNSAGRERVLDLVRVEPDRLEVRVEGSDE
jgi:hypothetical protein